MRSRIAATVSGCINDGVPPPKKMLDTIRGPVRSRVYSSSRTNAVRKRTSSMPPKRT
jgi:hypothetical protein